MEEGGGETYQENMRARDGGEREERPETPRDSFILWRRRSWMDTVHSCCTFRMDCKYMMHCCFGGFAFRG